MSSIKYEVVGKVAVITIDRPEKMNALYGTAENNGTVAKVGEYMRAADDDPDIPEMAEGGRI